MEDIKKVNEVRNSSLFHGILYSVSEVLRDHIDYDDISLSMMKLFEPFIEERMNNYELYKQLREDVLNNLKTEMKELIDKICIWLRENIKNYTLDDYGIEKLITDLKSKIYERN